MKDAVPAGTWRRGPELRDALEIDGVERGEAKRLLGSSLVDQRERPVPLLRQVGRADLAVTLERRHIIDVENREYPYRLVAALDADQIELGERLIRYEQRRRFAEDEIEAIGLAGPFQARGQVHGVAQHRVLHALVRAHIADAALAGVDADTDADRLERLSGGRGLALGVEC